MALDDDVENYFIGELKLLDIDVSSLHLIQSLGNHDNCLASKARPHEIVKEVAQNK